MLVTARVSKTHINIITVAARVTEAPARATVLMAPVARVTGAVGGGAAAWAGAKLLRKYILNINIPVPSVYQPPS